VIVTRGLGKARVLGAIVAAGLAIGGAQESLLPNTAYWVYATSEIRVVVQEEQVEDRTHVIPTENRVAVVVELSRTIVLPSEDRVVEVGV
jgi:hypothetical protein